MESCCSPQAALACNLRLAAALVLLLLQTQLCCSYVTENTTLSLAETCGAVMGLNKSAATDGLLNELLNHHLAALPECPSSLSILMLSKEQSIHTLPHLQALGSEMYRRYLIGGGLMHGGHHVLFADLDHLPLMGNLSEAFDAVLFTKFYDIETVKRIKAEYPGERLEAGEPAAARRGGAIHACVASSDK